MKDFEVKFSLKNLFRDTPKEVASLQTYIKVSAFFTAGSTWASFGLWPAVIIAGVGFIIDLALHCVHLEEKK